jgi:hypothetical protein
LPAAHAAASSAAGRVLLESEFVNTSRANTRSPHNSQLGDWTNNHNPNVSMNRKRQPTRQEEREDQIALEFEKMEEAAEAIQLPDKHKDLSTRNQMLYYPGTRSILRM